MKFYPSDLRAEPTLKMCSWEARWLWMEMICLMHEADPYGHLVVNGNPVTDMQLALLTGADVSTVQRLKSELETNGVFSISKKGIIYSRRMTRDEKKSKDGRKSVEKRWSQVSDIKEKKSPPNRSPNRSPITKKPEARSQNNKLNKSYAFEGEHVIRLDDDDFEKWLEIYGGNEGQFRDFLWQKDQWYAQQPPEKRKNWFISTANHIRSLRV